MNLAKIVRLLPKDKADTIAALEMLMEKAHNCEFDNFIFAAKTKDGEIATSWANADLGERNELISHIQMDLVLGTVEHYFEEE
jgi:hypothetical protein